jgi:hypothetical protein
MPLPGRSPALRGPFSGEKFAHKTEDNSHQSNLQWVGQIGVHGRIIDEHHTARLVHTVKQGVPIEHY